MTHQQTVEKIKKLISLATSSNEHEAKLALEQAQKLIQKYNVDNESLLDVPPEETKVIIQESTVQLRISNAAIKYIPLIGGAIAKLFGSFYIYTISQELNFKLVGYPTNNEIVLYTLEAVLNQGNFLYKEAYRNTKDVGLNFSDGFWNGFAEAFVRKFASLRQETYGLIIYDKVKQTVKENFPNLLKVQHQNQIWLFGNKEGSLAAEQVQLNKGVKGNQVKGYV